MEHDLEDCGMTRSDLQINLVGMKMIFYAAIQTIPQILK
jgi:threonine/homoserine efflux transporter RhtA